MNLNEKLDRIVKQLEDKRNSVAANSHDPYANEDSDWRAGIRRGLEIAKDIVAGNKE